MTSYSDRSGFASSGPVALISGAVMHFARAFAAERRRRRAIRGLRELDDRLLADIGLARRGMAPAVRPTGH